MGDGQQAESGGSLASDPLFFSCYVVRIEVCKEALTLEALGPVPSCGGLNDKCPHRFMNLETWSLVGDPVCGGPGYGEVQLDWRKYTSGVGFESS